MKCEKCGASNWGVAERPFQRNFCLKCDFTPVSTMPGPQTDFVKSKAMHPAYLGGRGAAKTVAGVIKTFLFVAENPGANGAISLPTYVDIERSLLPVIREFFSAQEGKLWEYKKKDNQITFPELGSKIFLLTAEEPESPRGMSLAFFWMDEIGRGNQKQMFLNLQPCLRQAGFPHQGWVTSTPQVHSPWIKQIWADGIHPITDMEIHDWAGRYPIFRARTIDNVCLPDTIREGLLKDWEGSRLAAQELGGEFLAVEGVAFPDLREGVHLRAPTDQEFIATVVGLDFGGAQPTAMVEMKMDRSRKVWVTREFYKRNATDYDWISTLAEWDARVILCDPSASEKDMKTWRRMYGINIKPALSARRFDERYRLILSRLTIKEDGYPGLYISPACQNLWNELINLAHYMKKGSEEVESRWSPGTADHLYDATGYGLTYFERGYIGRPQKTLELVKA